MKRKVSKIGPATLMVSLPSKWVKKYGVKKGDEVEVEEKGNSLILFGKGSKEPKKIKVNIISNDEVQIRSFMGGLYRGGYDEIEVTFQDNDVYLKIEKAVNSLIGLEVMDKKQNFCIIKYLASSDKLSPMKNLNKMFFVLKEIQNILTNDLKENKFNNLGEVEALRLTNWRFRDYYQRNVTKEDIPEELKLAYSHLFWTLEKIGSYYLLMYKKLVQRKNNTITKELINLAKDASTYLDLFMETLISKEFSSTEKIRDTREKLVNIIQHLLKERNHDTFIICWLMTIVLLVYDANSSLIVVNSISSQAEG